jgi:cytoskeletal protein RodZ
MPTLGEELRRRREERGISLNDISESTRIGTRFLKAIETDNFSILPGGIFTRSFIRAFAKEVGMNEDEAIGLYQQQTGSPPAQAQQPPTETRAPKTTPIEPPLRRSESITYRQSTTRTSWPTIIIAGGIVLFIAIIVIALVKQLNKGSETQQTSNTAATQRQPAPQPAAEPAQPAGTGAPEIPAGDPIVVKLEAINGESWLGYEADGSKAKPILLKQGEATQISAKEKVKLNLGNRQALKMVINNKDASFPENTPKTVAKIEISRDNLQTFFQ